MDLNQFKEKIKSRELGGCYVFCGEEDYLKKYYLSELRSACITDASLATFNHTVYDGPDASLASIMDDIKSPPMFDDFKFIEWKYPSLDKMKESDVKAFDNVLEMMSDYPYAVFALLLNEGEVDLGTPKRQGKFAKKYADKINILSFDKSTDAQLLSWLKKHFDSQGVGADAPSIRALLFRSGHSMSVLKNEVDKLCALVKARGLSSISESLVAECASSTVECDTFALSNAVLARDKAAALLAMEELKAQRTDPMIIMGMLAKTYSELSTVTLMLRDGVGPDDIATATKINQYKVKMYIAAGKKYPGNTVVRLLEELQRVDSESKYRGVSGYTAIDLFISKCL